MANYKTPGAYVQEISTLPASVAAVPTAVSGFTGYTEKAMINGAQWNYTSGPAPAVRITSMLEYEQVFGLPYKENFKVTISDPAPLQTQPQIAVVRDTPASAKNYILYYQLQMFFSNGGGVCWIASVGDYSSAIDKSKLIGGLGLFEAIDEVTLLLAPEAISLTGTGFRKEVNDAMLAQCAKLGDRFSVFDVYTTGNVNTDGTDFRNDDVGSDNLKFGAAYYPSLNSSLNYYYSDDEVLIDDTRTSPVYDTFPNNTLSTINNGILDRLEIAITGTSISNNKVFTINSITFKAKTSSPNFNANEFLTVASDPAATATNLAAALVRANMSNLIISKDTTKVGIRATSLGLAIGFTSDFDNTTFTPVAPGPLAGGLANSSDKELYNRIAAVLDTYEVTLYPAPAMAGIYARVDNDRGVWQAPANVGVFSVNSPSVLVTNTEQGDLNINSTSGKSINAIRRFTGKGNLVWGARTLAGNDNEWRYVNVRRLFLFMEESIQEATEFVVFEPNTAATWQKIKGMIESFLTSLWRDGALAGATTKDAFFVEVGLGVTMTSDDILNGILNVRIGVAAVRPAEFIILKFSHKLQEA